jgi:hypothetical protein
MEPQQRRPRADLDCSAIGWMDGWKEANTEDKNCGRNLHYHLKSTAILKCEVIN